MATALRLGFESAEVTEMGSSNEYLFHSCVLQTKHFHWSDRHCCLRKLSRVKNKHARKNVHASQLKANGSKDTKFNQAICWIYCKLSTRTGCSIFLIN